MAGDLRCPDQPTLEKILLGQLAGAEAQCWEEHLGSCSRCANTLGNMQKEDHLTTHLRNGNSAPPLEDRVVEELIQQLKKLVPGTASSGEQLAPDVVARTPQATGEAGDEDCDFLSPPRDAGELGGLGHYRVLRKLGQGGMGIVFEAQDLKLHRHVALKVMLPSRLRDADSRRRFLQEARAAAAVEHERIVAIYQVDEENGVPFLAMQLLQGESLEARLRRCPGPYPVSVLVRLGREIAEGLEAAHRLGLVHRDIKPSNLWLQADEDHIKILDFGLASLAGIDARLTPSSMIVGTPGFLAPEQAAGRAVDARTDLFSLGVVLYLLAAGRLPFDGADVLALLNALAVGTPRPIQELNPALRGPLNDLIMRLLSKAPDDRPGSAREVIDVLTALEGPLPAPSQTERIPRPHAQAKPTSRRKRLVSRGVLAGLSLALLLGLSLLALHFLFPGDGDGRDEVAVAALQKPALAAGIWTVLFRSDDPRIWNTDTPGVKFAIPVREAPPDIRYLRLKRMDTGQALILPVTQKQLVLDHRPPSRQGSWWNGTARQEHGGRHLGIVQAPRFPWPNHRGVISVADEGWDAFSGSGFGAKCQFNDGQYFCWEGKEIPRTVFEIAVTAGPLIEAENRAILK